MVASLILQIPQPYSFNTQPTELSTPSYPANPVTRTNISPAPQTTLSTAAAPTIADSTTTDTTTRTTTAVEPSFSPSLLDAEWRTQYNFLLEFKAVTGHCQVPDDGTPLRKWVERQHRDYTTFCDMMEGRVKADVTATTFHEEKLLLLRRAGFVFTKMVHKRVAARRSRFDANCELIKEFRAKYGHVDIPTGRKAVSDFLGIDPDQDEEPMDNEDENNDNNDDDEGDEDGGAERGNEDGNGNDRAEEKINNNDVEGGSAKKLRKKHEDDCEEFKKWNRLGSWLGVLRTQHKKNRDNPKLKQDDDMLSPENLIRLGDIGISLEGSRERKRNALPNALSPENPIQLDDIGLSLEGSREKKRQATHNAPIPEAKYHGLGPTAKRTKVICKKKEDVWDSCFEEMREFYAINGHFMVPASDKKYAQLRYWLDIQRREHRKLQRNGESSYLTARRLSKLADSGFQFQATIQKKSFEEQFRRWVEYRENNNGRDPKRWGEDGIGKWISMTRRKKRDWDSGKKTTLTQGQIDLLNSKGFVWNVMTTPQKLCERKPWNERYDELLEFKRDNGHTSVPQAVAGLGAWVHKQRTKYFEIQRGRRSRNNHLTQAMIDKLNAIDFEWAVRYRTERKSKQEDDTKTATTTTATTTTATTTTAATTTTRPNPPKSKCGSGTTATDDDDECCDDSEDEDDDDEEEEDDDEEEEEDEENNAGRNPRLLYGRDLQQREGRHQRAYLQPKIASIPATQRAAAAAVALQTTTMPATTPPIMTIKKRTSSSTIE